MKEHDWDGHGGCVADCRTCAVDALLPALKELSFRHAQLVAALGVFHDIDARLLDAATAAIAKAEGR